MELNVLLEVEKIYFRVMNYNIFKRIFREIIILIFLVDNIYIIIKDFF